MKNNTAYAELMAYVRQTEALLLLTPAALAKARMELAAEDEPALASLAQWDQSKGVPRAAILVQTAVELALIAWGAASGRGFATMVDYLSPIYWLFLTMSGLAVVILRMRQPEVERPYKVPLYPLLPRLFAAACAGVLYSSVVYVGLGPHRATRVDPKGFCQRL